MDMDSATLSKGIATDRQRPEAVASAVVGTVGAFFDMDYTLLSASSGILYLRYLISIRHLPWWRWPPIMTSIAGYLLGIVSFPSLMGNLMRRAVGEGEEAAWRLSRAWFDTMLRKYIAEGARQQVIWHQSQGHHVAIVSAATPYAVDPVAAELGLGKAYLATQLEVVAGHFTGKVCQPACHGTGKLLLTRSYAENHGLDLAHSYFYTDSHHDIPLLEAVEHPIAVNPNKRLASIAAQRNWSVMRFY